MVTVRYQTFQNIGFSVGIETKNGPLNIPIFGSELIFFKKYALGKKKWDSSLVEILHCEGVFSCFIEDVWEWRMVKRKSLGNVG